MRIKFPFLIFLLVSLNGTFLHSQNRKLDSLINKLNNSKRDTSRVSLLNTISFEYFTLVETQKSIKYANDALLLSTELKWKAGMAKAYDRLGEVYYSDGEYSDAIKNYSSAIETELSIGDKISAAKHYGRLGVVYKNLGNYSKALEYYLNALKIGEQLNDKNILSTVLGNIGNLYKEQENYEMAIEFYNRALKASEDLGDKNAIARNLSNMGTVYSSKNEYAKALEYFNRALVAAEQNNYKQLQANVLLNIGNVFKSQGDSLRDPNVASGSDPHYDSAMVKYQKSLELNKQINNKYNVALSLSNMAGILFEKKKYKEEELLLLEALEIAIKLKSLNLERVMNQKLYKLYSTTGNDHLALIALRGYYRATDSINNDNQTKKQTQFEMQYKFGKQHDADSIKNAEQIKQEELKHNQEIKQQKIYTYGGAIGFVLMLIVAGVSFRAFKQKQKTNTIITLQKEEVEKQKFLVEQKQKEILDSIHYAKRIQQSLMPTDSYIEKSLNKRKNKD